mgnify:CR=1 FL=1
MLTLPLDSEDRGKVRILSLKRPEKKNCFDLALTETLWSALEHASEDPSIHVVVVTGFGDYFSAGADVNLFLGAGGGDISKVARLYEPLKACKKTTIAAVNGPAVGYGVTLLTWCDFVIASDRATFSFPEVRLGVPTIVGALLGVVGLCALGWVAWLWWLDIGPQTGWGWLMRINRRLDGSYATKYQRC